MAICCEMEAAQWQWAFPLFLVRPRLSGQAHVQVYIGLGGIWTLVYNPIEPGSMYLLHKGVLAYRDHPSLITS